MIIAPSLLAANFSCLGEEIQKVEQAGADWLHLDVMDGHFVPNLTFGPLVIKALRPLSRLVFDAHLMIAPVDPLLEAFKEAGVDRLTIHPEAGPHVHRSLQAIKKLGLKAGVALNPGTPVSVVEPLLDILDHVLVMTVNPGFGGQAFLKDQCCKIFQLTHLIGERPILIQVDGGINKETIPLVKGAHVVVAGTAIFGQPDYQSAISSLRC